ncbi:MAG: helix-turn-helix domain-containing protein, partial [Promethearchaeota archaeon]
MSQIIFIRRCNEFNVFVMIAQYTSFLNEMGFSNIQIKIYEFLLANKVGTINEIKNELNFSYTQVYNN